MDTENNNGKEKKRLHLELRKTPAKQDDVSKSRDKDAEKPTVKPVSKLSLKLPGKPVSVETDGSFLLPEDSSGKTGSDEPSPEAEDEQKTKVKVSRAEPGETDTYLSRITGDGSDPDAPRVVDPGAPYRQNDDDWEKTNSDKMRAIFSLEPKASRESELFEKTIEEEKERAKEVEELELSDRYRRNLLTSEKLAVLGLFILSALIFLAPIIFFMKSRIWGYLGLEDTQGTIWTYWLWKNYVLELWKEYMGAGFSFGALTKFLVEFFQFPVKANMGNFTDYLPTFILESIVGFPVYYNLRLVIIFVLNGFSFFFLAHYLLKDKVTAFVVSLMFALSPFFFLSSYFGWMEQVYLFPLPLFLLYFIKALHEDEERPKNAFLCGIFLAVTALFYWFYGMFAVMFAVAYLIYYPFSKWNHVDVARGFNAIVLAGVVFLVLVTPFILPYVQMKNEGREIQGVYKHADFPKPEEAVGEEVNTITDSCSAEYPWKMVDRKYVPPVILVLIVISLLFIRQTPLIWYFGMLLFYLLSLGPYLKIGGKVYSPLVDLILYRFLYKFMPFFTRFHWPSRTQGLMLIFAMLLAGYAIVNVGDFFKKVKYLSTILSVIVLGVYLYFVFAAGFLPLGVTPFKPADFYTRLGKNDLKLGIVETPFNHDDVIFEKPMIYNFYNADSYYVNTFNQVVHGKKIMVDPMPIGKEYPRETAVPLSHRGDTLHPFLRYLAKVSVNPGKTPPLGSSERAYVKKLGYRYIAVHKIYFWIMAAKVEGNRGSRSDRERIMNELYNSYVERMKKEFGNPVSVGEEELWQGGDSAYHSDMELKELELKKWPVLFFEIK